MNAPESENTSDDEAIQSLVDDDDSENGEDSAAEIVEVTRRPPPGAIDARKATPLTRYDPLEAYMRDVQRHPLLKPEEEHEYAVRYHETGDVDAAARLVSANLRLVVKIAYEYRRAHRQLPDLIQEGSIGLMHAVKKYDPYKGVKLSTYAAWWIRAYILRFILNNARLVKLGTTQAQRKLFFNLKKEKARLSAMGIEPTAERIAGRLGVNKDEVVQMDRRLSAGDMSLDAPTRTSEGDGPSRVDLLPGHAPAADDVIADEEVNELVLGKVREFGEGLEGKEATIFHERMLAEDPKTLQELGEGFGVSRERVRQLESRLQVKLKKYLASELGPDLFEP